MEGALFTTLRVTDGRIRFWSEHVERLRPGAPDLDPDALLASVVAAVRAIGDARVRITVRPPEPPLVEAQPYTAPRDPWRLRPVPVSHAGDAPLQKTTDRARYDRARAAAEQADDALLISPEGRILETTVANVFFLMPGGEVVTPPARGILPGIVRARLLPVAVERALGLKEAVEAPACVVTNALLIAHPVVSIEGVRSYESDALARDLRETVTRMAPDLRIIRP